MCNITHRLAEEEMKEAQRVEILQCNSVIHEGVSMLSDYFSTNGHIFAQTATLAIT